MSSLSATFFGALQGTISVLLTLVSGYVAARLGFIDSHTIHHLSKLCSHIFLPCLIVTQMGPGITFGQLRSLWIIPVWGLISSILSHIVGFFGKSLFGFSSWTILAAGRANSGALPLLLLQSLESVGVLDVLKQTSETSDQTLKRAKGFILLNTIVQEVLTFSIGTKILLYDYREAKHKDPETPTPREPSRRSSSIQHTETVGLLDEQDELFDEYDVDYISSVRRSYGATASQCLVKRVTKLASYLNPVIISALLAVLFGLTPQLHETFLSTDGIFYPFITQPLCNLGELFVVLQMFVVGAILQTVHTSNPGLLPTAFSLLIRYLVMPVISIVFVYSTARKGVYVDDPLLWFILILIPCGPSAMLLITIAENAGVYQGPVAGYLAIAYAFAPSVAFCCALALKVIDVIKTS